MHQIAPQVEVHESADEVCYRLIPDRGYRPVVQHGFGIVALALAVAAGAIVYFLLSHAAEIAWPLLALTLLLVAQLLFLARVPWNLYRRQQWQALTHDWGRQLLVLGRDRLALVAAVGPFRSTHARPLHQVRQVIVYVYPDSVAPGVDDQRHVLAIAGAGTDTWFLTDGFTRSTTLALADDLHRRLTHAGLSLPPLEIIHTHSNTLYPNTTPDVYRRRRPYWIAWNLGGIIGLAALTAAMMQTAVGRLLYMRLLLVAAGAFEALVLYFSFRLPVSGAPGSAEAQAQTKQDTTADDSATRHG